MGEYIYLDYNATTPVAPEALQAALPYLQSEFGNPSSGHPLGVRARAGLEAARGQVAALLGCSPAEVLFTSGGTESNNLALRGLLATRSGPPGHVVTTAIEHPAILQVCAWLEHAGWAVTRLPVDGQARVDPEALERALRPDTALVSIMLANNEVGTVQDLPALSAICRRRGVRLHTDAAQAVGKIATRVDALGVDLLSIAGHKLYAPKGVGALYVRAGVTLAPVLRGAGQERGVRPGTENVAYAAALGAAAELAERTLATEGPRLVTLRDRLAAALRHKLGTGAVKVQAEEAMRLPNTLSASLKGVAATDLVAQLAPELACSAGAACHSGEVKASAVLRAMGVDTEWALGTVRLSLGRGTTAEVVDRAAALVAKTARDLRAGA